MAQEYPLLSLCSSNSSRVLQITARGESFLIATLAGPTLSGAVEVWVETGDVAGLANFFVELAALDAPWKGSRTWSSLEGDLVVSASCTKLGAVTFQVSMSGMSGAPEEWRLQAGLETEFGQLGKLAADAMELVTR
ncbi:DUF6228 family protein [Hydrogenophaga sp.]|uniref:DUF6228 family protein n=1 Tax=Hydrogenophaga sp. TaxID=1904254 RepID=UPI00286D9CB2|nr:DUF6228 family protein [Hydrogenophaga sp.]